ncbi:MAG: hypothetical protein P4L45_09805 [Ignavibacteriaceae bacterium]|nr:hypothetical protein [Ignavibacteriaceae bacterium]
MFELFIWCIIIYVIFKVMKVFLRFFIPEMKGKEERRQTKPPESKFKDAEEVDFIEIKSDKKDGKDQE